MDRMEKRRTGKDRGASDALPRGRLLRRLVWNDVRRAMIKAFFIVTRKD